MNHWQLTVKREKKKSVVYLNYYIMLVKLLLLCDWLPVNARQCRIAAQFRFDPRVNETVK